MAHSNKQERDSRTEMSRKKMYEQPEGLIAGFLWKLWIKMQTTFALSMLETWEILLIFAITAFFTLLVVVAIAQYLPRAIVFAARRAQYYLSGPDPVIDTMKMRT